MKFLFKYKIMRTISKKYIKDYLTNNYGEVRHDLDAMVKACRQTSKVAECSPKEIFHFIIENQDFNGFCNSYGFNTRYGRSIKEDFKSNYYTVLHKVKESVY